jgi:hypothetical protein
MLDVLAATSARWARTPPKKMGGPLPRLGYGLDVLPRRCSDTFRLLDAVGARRREDDADVPQPEGVVRARQALDHHLRLSCRP